ncbi:MAG TPA: leucyl/phenylalanyl-tRNA--protein transferase [Ignavibacteriaceae bacterium]|nr:leucyl/phenylalanyl-tRNA--protein transferase [Ignavibacteriaceae bacterium]
MSFKEEYKEFLRPDLMIKMYANGAFPMADSDTGIINWYLPKVRTIIPLDNYNYPRSLRKFISDSDFEFRYDTNFLSIVKNCANREETWINEELIEAYKNLYKTGNIHTVEVYQKNKLVGGLYGITFRGAFFGESMFSIKEQASKAALIKLIERLNEKEFVLLDVQYMTEHLKMFGAVEIEFEEYVSILNKAYEQNIEF